MIIIIIEGIVILLVGMYYDCCSNSPVSLIEPNSHRVSDWFLLVESTRRLFFPKGCDTRRMFHRNQYENRYNIQPQT